MIDKSCDNISNVDLGDDDEGDKLIEEGNEHDGDKLLFTEQSQPVVNDKEVKKRKGDDDGSAFCDDDDDNDADREKNKNDVTVQEWEEEMEMEEQGERKEDEEEGNENNCDESNSNPAIPIDSGRAWCVMIACFLMHVLVVGGGKSFGVFVQEFQDRFQVGAKELGVINGMTLMLMFCLSIFVNMLVVRFSARRVVVAGSILASSGFVMTAFIPSFKWLYVTYGLVVGLGFGLSFSPTIVAVGQSFKKYRAFAYGVSLSGSGIGSFGIPNLVRLLVKEYSLQGCLLILGAIMLNVSLCGFLLPSGYPLQSQSKRKTVSESDKHRRRIDELSQDRIGEVKGCDLKLVNGHSESEENFVKSTSTDNPNYSQCKVNTEDEEKPFLQTELYCDDSLKRKDIYEQNNSVPKITIDDFDMEIHVENERKHPNAGHTDFHDCHNYRQRALTLTNGQTPNANANLQNTKVVSLHSTNNDASKSTKSLHDHDLHHIAITRNILAHQHKDKINSISVSASHLPNKLKPNIFISIESLHPKHSLNKLASSLTYASTCDIAMVSQGNLDRVSIVTLRSRDLKPSNHHHQSGDVKEKVPLLELSMLRSPPFIMHLMSVVLGFTCYMNNLFMLADHARTCGLSLDMAALTLSIVGIVETVARLTFAPLTDVLCCTRRRSWAGALAAMGLINILAPQMQSLPSLMAYAVLFGYSCGCFGCLIPVLCAEINGPEKLGSSFGLTTFGMGLALMIGPPMCGAIKDQTGYWDNAFVTVGILSLIAAVLAFLGPTVQARMESKNNNKNGT